MINGVTQGRFLDDPFFQPYPRARRSTRRAALSSSSAASKAGR
jgi:hypothetical protein